MTKRELSKTQRERLTETAADAAEAHRQAAAKRKRAGTKDDKATAQASSRAIWNRVTKTIAKPAAARVIEG